MRWVETQVLLPPQRGTLDQKISESSTSIPLITLNLDNPVHNIVESRLQRNSVQHLSAADGSVLGTRESVH